MSLVLWQCGHPGFSSPRMSNSTFRLHFSQEYSYNGIGFMNAVGKPVKPPMPKGGQLALSEVVVQDRFA